MKNKVVVVIGLIILALFIGELVLGLFTQKPVPGDVTSSSAMSSIAQPTGLAGQATADNGTIACSMASAIQTNADGSQQSQLSWNVTPGTEVFIPELSLDGNGGYVSYNANGSVKTPVLTKTSSYSIVVTTGVSTSTCQVSATPTSFSASMPADVGQLQ